jgi:hypothetical protein
MNIRLGVLVGASVAALVLAGTSGATHLGSLELGHPNTSTAPTVLTANLTDPVLKVVNQGTAAALRGEAQNGIGVNGISVTGTGQFGQSGSGIGMFGVHSGSTGTSPGVQGQTVSTDANAAGVTGNNTGGGPGLRAIVNVGAPPLLVNSSVKVTNLNADLLDGLDSAGFWKLGGNASTTPGTDFLGTTDDAALELKVNGQRAFRLEPNATSPNVIGGSVNLASGGAVGATIGGGGQAGFPNTVNASLGTIGGGQNNTAGFGGTVGGGDTNVASGSISTVGGGQINTAGGIDATIGAGYGNTASGLLGTIPGGASNSAQGAYSFAAGRRAKAVGQGSFVWGDSTDADVASAGANTFSVRAAGGIWLGTTSSPAITVGHFIDTSTGAFLSSAGAWTDVSDRALKHGFRPLDRQSVLRKVAGMPITSWSYRAEEPSVRHIGPTAQDFHAAFGLGLDDKHIATLDEAGVALAAIQGLYRQNQALRSQNRSLSARLDRLEKSLGK